MEGLVSYMSGCELVIGLPNQCPSPRVNQVYLEVLLTTCMIHPEAGLQPVAAICNQALPVTANLRIGSKRPHGGPPA